MNTLTFDRLRETNVARCEDVFHPLASWSLTEWALAMIGEAGEVCNVVKKINRGDHAADQGLGAELADVVIYADLLAARAGINLEAAIVEKFNAVSRKRGSSVRL